MRSEKLEAILGVGVVLLILGATIVPTFGVLAALVMLVWIASEMRR